MSYSRFRYDVFVNFTRFDNQPKAADGEGWVSRFSRDLGMRLRVMLGEEPSVFRAERLLDSDNFAVELANTVQNSAVLVVVLTPRYVRSQWCREEFRLFLESAGQTGGVFLEHTARYFKVLPGPVSPQELSPELRAVVGYEFFELASDGIAREFDPQHEGEFQRKYYEALNRLAQDIVDVLYLLRKDEPKAETSPEFPVTDTVLTPAPDSMTNVEKARDFELLESVLSPGEEKSAGSGSPSHGGLGKVIAEVIADAKRVFVSYAHQDESFVVELAARLRAAGIPVWRDKDDIAKGDDWDRSIDHALYHYPGFMIVLSPIAVESDEVRSELRVALNRHKKKDINLFPVLYQQCDVPRQLLLIENADLTAEGPNRDAEIQSLISDIKTKLQLQ
jgi:hypothetical protein